MPHIKDGVRDEKLVTPSITKLDDGTICIGDQCSVIRIPPKGDIEIDVSQCPDEVRELIARKVGVDGVSTGYKASRKNK